MSIEYMVPGIREKDKFNFPEDINQILSLVNRLFFDGISLVDIDGTVYGFFVTIDQEGVPPIPYMNNDTGKVVMMFGEDNLGVMFDSLSEAKFFIKGMFYFAFSFKTVEEIENFLTSRQIVGVSYEKSASDWMTFLINPS